MELRTARRGVLRRVQAMVIAVAAAVAFGPSIVPAEAAEEVQSVPDRVAVLSWNICGTASQCPSRENPSAKLDEIVDIVEADPGYAVIMLQEACKSIHSDKLAERLGDGWVVRHRTAKIVGTARDVGCSMSGKADAGVAIAMKKLPGSDFVTGPDGRPGWDLTFTSTRGLEHVEGKDDLPKTNYTTQGAPCLQDQGNKLLACTSHFVHGGVADADEIQDASLKDFHRTTVDWQNGGYRTIVGGDFNIKVQDDDIDPMYDGNFEADSNDKCNTTGPRPSWYIGCRNSFGSKLDYIFFGDRGWGLRGGDVRYDGSDAYEDRELSDHWGITAAVSPS
ncbi:endonuclease/exonuclease/phosphatase family protein [Streptomyces indicus]|uniref:Endonuclease/Exonuclease/phosphatase family protein n=1 Tax=Streptomyces indicus TaxID=417292 RepID=A0A1G9JNR3_9ACTN|nr:endonuclease/exonuclease/phosphatase family protein [Streptomyces indicus]SDL38936.1 Endonuclease/Exonuclease/phosphatase family protein [Streptomyces indicus]